MGKRIVIAGATGMVGGELLKIALGSDDVSVVYSVGRRPVHYDHPKLREILVDDVGNASAYFDQFRDIHAAFYCVGVYTGAVSKPKFTEITVNFPVNFAKALAEHFPKASFSLLSGAGADRSEKSKIQFARDKGKAENALSELNLGKFYTFRPGYIYPVEKREEPNFSYRMMRPLYFLIKLFGKNASIKSTELARGMFEVGMSITHPKEELENRDILAIIS